MAATPTPAPSAGSAADTAPQAVDGGVADLVNEATSDPQTFLETWLPLIVEYAVLAAGALVIFILGLIVAGWAGRVVFGATQRAKFDLTLSKFFAKLARWTVLILVVLGILGYFGVETASFAVVLGGAALAIGLAFQGTLSNFASGVMLLTFRPFKVGDFINAGGVAGTVDEIELFTTVLNTPDNRRLIVPNSAIFGSTIENVTFHDRRRVDVSVGVDYEADLDQTRRVLQDAMATIDQTLPDPAPAAVLLELGDSSVNWVCRVWVNKADFWPVKDALTRAVKMKLDAANISIPFPQMDVHLDHPAQAG